MANLIGNKIKKKIFSKSKKFRGARFLLNEIFLCEKENELLMQIRYNVKCDCVTQVFMVNKKLMEKKTTHNYE